MASSTDEELLIAARGREAEVHYDWKPLMHNLQLRRWLHRIDVPTLVLRGSDGPDAWDYIEQDPIRVTTPNRLFDPVKGADLLNQRLDECVLADELGMNIMLNEHRSTTTCTRRTISSVASGSSRGPASYSVRFCTLNDVFGMWWQRAAL